MRKKNPIPIFALGLFVLLLGPATSALISQSASPRREVENVAAFARQMIGGCTSQRSEVRYADAVLGHVADHKLATIIGSATAGTNDTVHRFEVPGGFAIFFTAMRVTRHDGRTPFHLVGVKPDMLVEPTLAGNTSRARRVAGAGGGRNAGTEKVIEN